MAIRHWSGPVGARGLSIALDCAPRFRIHWRIRSTSGLHPDPGFRDRDLTSGFSICFNLLFHCSFIFLQARFIHFMRKAAKEGERRKK